jgi:hypothetical protein
MVMTLALEPGPTGVRVNNSTEKAARLLGADVFLNMPVFDASELLAEIHKLLPPVPKLQESKQSKDRD